jgi:hypothetical protein
MLTALLGLLMAHDLHAAPAPQPPAPTLHLDGVMLGYLTQRDGAVELSLVCAARWENAGEPIPAETGFQGVFDDVTLVAIDSGGREVVRQHTTWHQSPALPHPVTLAAGQTKASITFPISGVPLADIAQVRLEGGLVGTDVAAGSVTEWRPVLVFR